MLILPNERSWYTSQMILLNTRKDSTCFNTASSKVPSLLTRPLCFRLFLFLLCSFMINFVVKLNISLHSSSILISIIINNLYSGNYKSCSPFQSFDNVPPLLHLTVLPSGLSVDPRVIALPCSRI